MKTFRIERSATIAAPREQIFPLIDDFQRWRSWSPWEDVDPALQRRYSGPSRGVGAAYAWEGNRKAGSGSMEILESTSPSVVRIRLDFLKPFKATNLAEFNLVPAGGGTRVTWAMSGPATLMSRVAGLFMDMDAMVGKYFEAGLANLKDLVEKQDG